MYALCPIRIGQYGREIKSPCIFRYQSHSQTGPIYTESHLIIITGNAIVYFYDMLFLLSLQIRTKLAPVVRLGMGEAYSLFNPA